MKTSELIKQLQEQMAISGDKEVRVYDTFNEFDAACGEVRYFPDDDTIWIYI